MWVFGTGTDIEKYYNSLNKKKITTCFSKLDACNITLN